MLFHVAYHCLASCDLIFNERVHFQVINRLIVSAPPGMILMNINCNNMRTQSWTFFIRVGITSLFFVQHDDGLFIKLKHVGACCDHWL
jgi:hypothetical protein